MLCPFGVVGGGKPNVTSAVTTKRCCILRIVIEFPFLPNPNPHLPRSSSTKRCCILRIVIEFPLLPNPNPPLPRGSTPKGRSMANPGRRNAVTTPGYCDALFTGTPKGRSGGRMASTARQA